MEADNQELEILESRASGALDAQAYAFLERGVPSLFQSLTELATTATGCCCAWIGWPNGQELHLNCRVGLNVSSVFLSNSHSREVLASGRPWISEDVARINWDLDSQREMEFLGIWPLQPVSKLTVATFSVAGLRSPPQGELGAKLLASLAELAGILIEVERLRRTRRGSRAAWAGLWQSAELGLDRLLQKVHRSAKPLPEAAEGLAQLVDELAGQSSRDRCMPESDYRSRAEDVEAVDQRLAQLTQSMRALAQSLSRRKTPPSWSPERGGR